MSDFDIIIRGAQAVTAERTARADIGVAGEKIAAIKPEISGLARQIIDAAGLHAFPGVIDSHVHFNEPGRTHWEGIATGSAAVAAGGGTLFFDMPLNAHPPTLDAASFELKRAAAAKSSRADFAFWGGLTPANLGRLPELADCGVIGYKAFMCNSGMDDFPFADERTLRAGMKSAAALGLPVAVHAESEEMTARLAAAAAGRTARDFLDARPILAELEAIARALELAGETGCRLHVVHVTCAAAVRLITEARARGIDASCETCPHYLLLTDEDVERLGPIAKCAPPPRSASESEALWAEFLAGRILTIGSDHSPSPPEMKTGADFFKAWGGISGAQHLLPLIFSRPVDLSLVARATSANVAQRFQLPPSKGKLAIGADADLALVKLGGDAEIKSSELFYRHQQSPYVGRHLQASVQRTILRGQTIFEAGQIKGEPRGQLVRPVRV
ncbi:MAG TPA: allantoinase AllB [Verrucomicrobiae bacterium]|jgi:allantoinase